MMTLQAYLESKGRTYPAPDSKGFITAAQMQAAGLPMIVACTHCQMTMATASTRKVDEHGNVFCDDCVEIIEDAERGTP